MGFQLRINQEYPKKRGTTIGENTGFDGYRVKNNGALIVGGITIGLNKRGSYKHVGEEECEGFDRCNTRGSNL